MLEILERLVDLIYPFLPSLKLKTASLGSPAKPSHLAEPKVLQYHMHGLVVVQDALEPAEKLPDDPFHRLLMNDGGFVELHNDYVAKKQSGYVERGQTRLCHLPLPSDMSQLPFRPYVAHLGISKPLLYLVPMELIHQTL
ncbi:hypothetical protein WJX74_004774 [Apatococcus lobatus]|uniref:Uncharacterized protein n=1 Tax=Apatococcus lobatus TaxID=904363 RepID=A0AAW1RN31_9CHLO